MSSEPYALRASAEPGQFSSTAVDTYTTVYYDFEPTIWQGRTRIDNTLQKGQLWHVDDRYTFPIDRPNPFNPVTTIKFDMKDAGSYSIAWDGKNNLGASVASGVYFYKMETKGFAATKKLVLLR